MGPGEAEIDRYLRQNKLLVKWNNILSSLERPFGRSNSYETYSYAMCRLISLFFIASRMLIFIMLGCNCGLLRLYLADWTVLYPATRRSHLLQSTLITCLISIFIHVNIINPRKFSPAIIDFISEDPRTIFGQPKLQPSRIEASSSNLRRHNNNNNNNNRLSDCDDFGDFDEFASDSTDDCESSIELDDWPPKTRPSIALQADLGAQASELAHRFVASLENIFSPGIVHNEYLRTLQLRSVAKPRQLLNLQSWLHISSRLYQARMLMRAFSSVLIIGATGISLLNFGTMSTVARPCDYFGSHLQFFSIIDVAFINVDCLMTIVGLSFHGILVNIYMLKLITLTKQQVLLTLGEANSTGAAKVWQHSEATTMTSSAEVQAAPSPFVLSINPAVYRDRASYGYTKSLGAESSSLSTILSEDSSTSKLRKIISNTSNGNNKGTGVASIEPEPEFLYTKTLSLSSQARAKPILASDLALVRRLVIDMLQAIDEQKQLVSFIGGMLYFWLFSGSLFVAVFLLTSKSRDDIMAFPIIMGPILFMCLAFAILCSNINKQAYDVAELVFRVCARCPGDTFLRHWNRIFCKWYYPNRCAFSAGGLLDMTYVNILKTISYSITGATLVISFRAR